MGTAPEIGHAAAMQEELTEGWLLNRRIRYAQPRQGYRTGLEPVLLASAIPARAGQRVLEAGCGAGAGLLCLAARVPDLRGLGVERDPAMVAIARHNIAANEHACLEVREGDVAQFIAGEPFDHAFANPPWHDPAGTMSPSARREGAKRAHAGLLETWIGVLLRAVKPGGSVTLILPAAQFPAACAHFQALAAGQITLTPLWPRAGAAARLALISARKDIGAPARVSAGLVLHEGAKFTAEADRILRGGGAMQGAGEGR